MSTFMNKQLLFKVLLMYLFCTVSGNKEKGDVVVTEEEIVTALAAAPAAGAESAAVSSAATSGVAAPVTSARPPLPLLQSFKLPCSCRQGQCGCCTGYILDRLNQKVCMNMTADPEDFSISAAMYLNGKVWYRNTVSGKNPPPMCIRLPRFRFIKFCVEFSNIYIANRNIHFCIDAEANWEDLTLLEWSFDCVRMGASGVAVVRPEDGGGLPGNPIDTEEQTDEDYEDSARQNPAVNSKKIIFHKSLSRIADKSPDRRLVTIKTLKNGDYFLKYAGRHN